MALKGLLSTAAATCFALSGLPEGQEALRTPVSELLKNPQFFAGLTIAVSEIPSVLQVVIPKWNPARLSGIMALPSRPALIMTGLPGLVAAGFTFGSGDFSMIFNRRAAQTEKFPAIPVNQGKILHRPQPW